MIYTLTLSASADYTLRLSGALAAGEVNRAVALPLRAGGKGINAAIILSRLGNETAALGFLGGHTGDIISDCLESEGVRNETDALPEGETRINVKLCGTEITEINADSPPVPPSLREALLGRLDRLTADDILVVSGRVPDDLGSEYLCKILDRAAKSGALLVCDTSGEALRAALFYKPFLIKPNREELSELCGEVLTDEADFARAALSVCSGGVRNVLVSLGPDGALLASGGRVLTIPAVPVKVINTVGSGDSMVAGFVSGFLASDDITRALRLGCAAGSASAGSEWLASRSEIERLYEVTGGTVIERSKEKER